MAYYPDLTKHPDKRNIFKVGWLDKQHSFERGRAPRWMVEKLWIHCQHVMEPYGGFYECNLPGCSGPARKLKFRYDRGKTATLRKLRQDVARAKNAIQTGHQSRTSTVRLFLPMLEKAFRDARRGYSRMILGVHPDTGEQIELGYADIFVFTGDGTYVAPNMIYHYVTVHQYKPPYEFIRALKYASCPPDPEYMDCLKRAGLPAVFVDSYQKIWEERKSQRDAKRKSF